MAKILLIHPDNDYNKIGFSLSLGSIGGALISAGHKVSYLLMYLYWNRHINIAEHLAGANIVGVTVSSCDFDNATKIARVIRMINPSIFLIAGGPHATFDPESLIREGFDICVRGEGEITIVEVVNCLNRFNDLDKLSPTLGISFRSARGPIQHNQDREYNSDLDSLELPDWHQDNYRRILRETYLPAYDATSGLLRGKVIAFMLESSRGCPYKCTFCTTSKIKGKQWRSKTNERILREANHFMGFCAREYSERPSKSCFLMQFPDDNFCFDIERAMQLCDALAAIKDKQIYWSIMARAGEMMNPDLIRKIRDAGCVRVFIGAECGYQSGLLKIKKGITLSMISSSLDSLVKADFPLIVVSWIIGFPWEKWGDAARTIWMAMKMAQKNADTIRSSIFTFSPLVGSDIAAELGIQVRGDQADHARDTTWGFEHPNMTNAELYELRLIANYLVFLYNNASRISQNNRKGNKLLLANNKLHAIKLSRLSNSATLFLFQRINDLINKIKTSSRIPYNKLKYQLSVIVDLLGGIIKKEPSDDVSFLS